MRSKCSQITASQNKAQEYSRPIFKKYPAAYHTNFQCLASNQKVLGMQKSLKTQPIIRIKIDPIRTDMEKSETWTNLVTFLLYKSSCILPTPSYNVTLSADWL